MVQVVQAVPQEAVVPEPAGPQEPMLPVVLEPLVRLSFPGLVHCRLLCLMPVRYVSLQEQLALWSAFVEEHILLQQV